MLNLIGNNLTYRRFLYFFSLVAGWPCVFYLMGWLPHYTINYLLLFVLSGFFVLLKNQYKLPAPVGFLLLFQIIVWVIYSAIHGLDTSYFTRIFYLCITYFILEMQMNDNHMNFVKTFNGWIVFQVIAGTIGFLLVLIGILTPIFVFREMDGRPGYFFGLFSTNTYLDGLIRNAGFYDEPGALAFWGMYALLINKLFVNNKKIELLLIFGLISTVSLAYFIQIFFYIYFFYKEQRKKILPYVGAFVISLVLISSFNERMRQSIWGRMEYDEKSGQFAGDNRSKMASLCWELFKEAPITGHGGRNLIDISQKRRRFVGANMYSTLACDGIIGQMIVWSPFFYLFSLRRHDKKYGWAFWILIIGFLQRPYDCTQLLFPLMSFTIILQSYLQINSNYNNAHSKPKLLA